MRFKALLAAAVVLLCPVSPAHAQAVKLRFHDGLVSLQTQNMPLRAILAEWARLGGTTIVNADRVAGPPLTLELNDVPERQAIDVLLRNVSGYMAATRPVSKPGPSVFDRILILPTSSAPRNAAPQPGFQPRQPQPLPQPAVVDPTVTDQDDSDNPPAGRPGVRVPFGQPQQAEPDNDQPDDQPTTAPTPSNPFGIPAGSTSRPGVVTPVPQQQQPRRTQPDPEP